MNSRLYTPKRIAEVMKANRIQFQKKFGQNFLIDGNIVRGIADVAEVTEQDIILEIGPGIGTMTEELLLRAKKVISIEIDDGLIPVLQNQFSHCTNFTLVHADALKADLKSLIEKEAEGRKVKIVANLPYYITSALIKRFLSENMPIISCTLMMQKEVGDRIIARPGTADYGSLTLFVHCYSNPSVKLEVPREVFMPKPKVDSVIVHFDQSDAIRKQLFKDMNMVEFTDMIHRMFQQRRKVATTTLSKIFKCKKAEIVQIFDQLKLNLNSRPENLSLQDYLMIYRMFKKVGLG